MLQLIQKPIQKVPIMSTLGRVNRQQDGAEGIEMASHKLEISHISWEMVLLACLGLTACHSLLGHDKEAAHNAAKVREIDPRFSLDAFEKSLPYKEQADKERFVNALSQAGLQ